MQETKRTRIRSYEVRMCRTRCCLKLRSPWSALNYSMHSRTTRHDVSSPVTPRRRMRTQVVGMAARYSASTAHKSKPDAIRPVPWDDDARVKPPLSSQGRLAPLDFSACCAAFWSDCMSTAVARRMSSAASRTSAGPAVAPGDQMADCPQSAKWRADGRAGCLFIFANRWSETGHSADPARSQALTTMVRDR